MPYRKINSKGIKDLNVSIKVIKLKKITKKKCWCGRRGTGILMHLWWGSKMKQLVWKTVWRFLRRLNEIPRDPAVPLGIYPREMETSVHAGTCA